MKNPGIKPRSFKFNRVIKLLVDFALSNNVALSIESADDVFVALESQGGAFASSGGHLDSHGAVFILDSSNGVALSVLFEVGVATSERVGASPEFDGVENETVDEAQADQVDTEDVQEEVNDGVNPLVTKGAVPVVKLVEASVLTIAAGKNDHAGAEKGNDTFFHCLVTP